MKTRFSSGDTVYIPATIKSASDWGGKIVYQIEECDIPVCESICISEEQATGEQKAKVSVHVECEELDKTEEKIQYLTEIIKKANSLLDELADKTVEITVQAVKA